MKSIFVESSLFEKYREEHLSDQEYRLFQAELMLNPQKGDVIQGQVVYGKLEFQVREKESAVDHVLSIIFLMNAIASTC